MWYNIPMIVSGTAEKREWTGTLQGASPRGYIQCRPAIRQLMFERDGRAVGEIEAAMEFEEVTNWRVNTNQQPDTYRLPCKVIQLNDIMNTLFEVVIRARRLKVKG